MSGQRHSDDLVAYVLGNRAAFTKEALTVELMAAGHAPEAIEAAWTEVEALDVAVQGQVGAPSDGALPASGTAKSTRQSVLQAIAILFALVAAAIGMFALVAMSNNRPLIQLYLVLFPVQIVLATRWVVRRIGRSESLRAGAVDVTLGWLFAPPLILLGIMGGCYAYGAAFGCLLHCS